MKRIINVLATGFGAGRVPIAPGTAGAAVGVGYWWLLTRLPVECYWIVVGAGVAAAVGIAGAAARAMGQPDPPCIVIDELCVVPLALAGVTGWWWLPAFVLFRLFDIWKPWPIRQSQRLPGGWGIVADDVLAAGLTCVVIWLVRQMASGQTAFG